MKERNILITGSTGYLAKIFVEKVLRIQPDVKKLFLLVRSTDDKSANQRLQTEVIGKELFKVLKEKHGASFNSFISDKVCPIAGDIIHENFGIGDSNLLEKLWKEVDIVINVAATTNFDERYDVALSINVLGAKHVLEFAKKCVKLEMLLHVSTAYVADMKQGMILEKPLKMGETLIKNLNLDIEAELALVQEEKKELQNEEGTKDAEKIAMKELGLKRARFYGWPNTYVFTKAMGEMLLGHLRGDIPLVIVRPSIITSIYRDPLPGWMEGRRTIDSMIIGYAKGRLPCFLGEFELVMDVIPGDMVVNAMIMTIVHHANQNSQSIYHIGSSVKNPVTFSILESSGYRYFDENPRIGKDGKALKTQKILVFRTMDKFRKYMNLRYRLPMEGLCLLNSAFCHLFSQACYDLKRRYKFVMHMVELYEPYAFFKGRFDDANLERLRISMTKESNEANMLSFDPKIIDWDDYFVNIHIPGVLKYVCK